MGTGPAAVEATLWVALEMWWTRITVSSCVWSSSSFRPDGDNSSTVSEQLDSVSVEATPNALGEYWKTTVHRGGELVRTELSSPLPTTETVSWDGVETMGWSAAGPYRVTVSVMDAQGNEDAGCEQVVELEQAYGAPVFGMSNDPQAQRRACDV